MGDYDYVRYAESDDGHSWRFPSLNQIECKGTKENNIAYGPPIVDAIGLHGPCVFKDPSAPPEERYKMIHTGHFTPDMKKRYQEGGLGRWAHNACEYDPVLGQVRGVRAQPFLRSPNDRPQCQR
jgi:hypothetical protein